MSDLLTTSNVTFFIGIIGVIFSIFFYFKKPQDETKLELALSDKELDSKASILAQKEMENKAALLDQQVKLERESNEKKFTDMGKRLDDAFTLAQNHIHTVDVRVEHLTGLMSEVNISLTKLQTIMEERLPRKQ